MNNLSLRLQKLPGLLSRTRCPVSVPGTGSSSSSGLVSPYRTASGYKLFGSCPRNFGCAANVNRAVTVSASRSRNQYSSLSLSTNCRTLANSTNIDVSSPRRFSSSDASSSSGSTQLPSKAKVVVCGGGVVGCSVGFHLAQRGCDVVLLEQGSLTCGTTWHAAGLVGGLRPIAADAAMLAYSISLYKQLQEEGYYTGWKNCGSLNLARTKDRLIAYNRALLTSQRFGLEGEFLTPAQIKERVPLLDTEDLEGGFWISSDGVAGPSDVATAMVKKGKELGLRVVEGCKVTKVLTKNEKVTGVKTNLGDIECQYFVNSAGMWARDLGQLSDPVVRVPLHACEHFYIVTKEIEGIDPMMPVIRDYDGFVYMREWSGGIMGGGFEPRGKPVFHDGVPDQFEYQLLPEDWDQFQVLLEQMLHRLPALSDAQVRQMTNGPESFTPDAKWIMGRSPEMQNYFVAAGMNSSGIAGAGGVGKMMSEWILDGEPTTNLWVNDVRRFVDLHNNKKFLKDRVAETLGTVLQVQPLVHPNDYLQTSRHVRMSPLYLRLHDRGATFGPDAAAIERALYYDVDDSDSDSDMPQFFTLHDDFPDTSMETKGSFGKPPWFDKVKAEYWACREGVCLIDMSTFSKFELRSAGEEVVNFLQYVCSNDVDRPVGTVIHTGMQNNNGGYENDCSVVRLESNRYFMISPTAQQTRSFAWLKEHLPADGSVQLSDVTSMYTAIDVLGPKSPELLAELTDAPLSKQDFGHMTCKEIDVGQASGIKAMRLTHSGEDGWMLYIPSEYALHVYDSLMSAGGNYGIRNAGYYALRALRTEKFYAYWGTDLTPQSTPMECGREYRVKLDQGGFIGHQALIRQRKQGIKKRLVQFMLEDHDVHNDIWAFGGEPIYRNGVYCGNTTSTAYGFTLEKFICLGYVHDYDEQTSKYNNISVDYILNKDAKYEINVAGHKFVARPAVYPPKLPPAGIVLGSG